MGDARETEKAPDAFRTISEVADDLELPQHVLRFWESRFTQIKPVKRAGGRRFYRPEDVDLLRGIRHLLYTDGFTIKGAQRVLKDQGVRYVQDLGIEREVASMRSARPARAAGGEGVTFGGLLGLLPRRRGKVRGGEEDALPDLPESAELPLPFPDAEADRDLAAEPAAPPMPLREARARNPRPERRDPAFEQPAFDRPAREPAPREARPADAGRREPSFRAPEPRGPERESDRYALDADPVRGGDRRALRPEAWSDSPAGPPRRSDPDADLGEEDFDEDVSHPVDRGQREPRREPQAPPRRPAPEARRGERVEPVLRAIQRPSRGPASRLATQGGEAHPHPPELDDPLLPFLEDFPPAVPVSEPIEDRIRRLKAQDRRPLRPHETPQDAYPDESGPTREDEPHPAPRRTGRDRPLLPEAEEEPGPPPEFIPRHARRAAPEPRDWLEAEDTPPRARAGGDRPLLDDSAWRQTDWVENAGRAGSRDVSADADGVGARSARPHRITGRHPADWRDDDVPMGWPQDLGADDAPPPRPENPSRSVRPPAIEDDGPAAGQRPAPLPARHRPPPAAAEPEYSMNDEDRPLERRLSERPGWPDARPASPRQAAPRAQNPYPQDIEQDFSARDLRREPSLEAPTGAHRAGERPVPRSPQAAAAHGHGEAAFRARSAPAGWQGEELRRAIGEEWGEGAPQALPRATRVGPLIGPISEEDGDDFSMPEAEQRLLAERMSTRGTVAHPVSAPAPPERSQTERGREASGAPGETAAAARSQSEPGQRLPREPLRPGPPEQYLPPHLRSEPRVVGQAPVAAPVLSRDDVHRMQSALYELGECRRLMDGLLGQRGEPRTAD